MAETVQGSQGSAFISYSRKDKEFVKKLNDALDNSSIQAWVDWEGIELASDWMQTITTAIQSHDAFIFVISPDSLKSKVCMDELEIGLKLNKKLIPVLYREPQKGQEMHEKLAATNWVYLRKQDNFDQTIPKLVESIQTDLEWVSQHTQILNQALEWDGKNRNNSFLLSGTKLQDSEKWMADASGKENRKVLPLQGEYISTSRAIATRNQRRLTITMSLLVVAAIVFGIYALIARNQAQLAEQDARISEATAVASEHIAATAQVVAEDKQKEAEVNQRLAEEKTIIANAERSVAEAQILQTRAGQLDESTLLAIESYNLNPTFSAENLIRSNTSRSALPVAQIKLDGAVWNIEWSPDYEYFVVGNNSDPSNTKAENKACVYQASNGSEKYCVFHDDDVNDAVFTKDGRYLVTGSADGTAKIWNTNDGSLFETLSFEGAVLDVDSSNAVIAIGRDDNFLTLYYLDKPDLDPVHVEQPDGVRSVKFSPSGELMAFSLQNGRVKFWQARNNFYYNGPEHMNSSYAVLAWSPDNNWLVSGGGDSLAMVTKRDGSTKYGFPHQDWVEGVAFGPDPSWFATASDDNIIRVVGTERGEELFRMSHTHFAQRVIVSSDGQWLASTGYDRVVRIWDSVSGTQQLEIPLEANGSAISFNEENSRIIAADENGNVSIWDISSLNNRIGFIEFTEFVRQARFTPSGEWLIVNADDYNIWKLPTNQLTQFPDGTAGEKIFTAESLTYQTTISPDSKWVAAVELDTENAQKNRGSLASIDGKSEAFLEHGGQVTGVAFSHDNQYVATSGTDGLVWFWDIESGAEVFSINNGEAVRALAISPTDSLVAVGLHDHTMIWDWSTQKVVTELPLVGDINVATFSRDGSFLATGSTENLVSVWKIDGRSITHHGNLLELNGFPRMLSFSPDNVWLAGGGSGGFAYIWDIATTQEYARIPHGNNPVTSIYFSNDGSKFVTVSRKVVRIWNSSNISFITRDMLIDAACSHLITNLSTDDWKKYFGEEEYRLTCPTLKQKEK